MHSAAGRGLDWVPPTPACPPTPNAAPTLLCSLPLPPCPKRGCHPLADGGWDWYPSGWIRDRDRGRRYTIYIVYPRGWQGVHHLREPPPPMMRSSRGGGGHRPVPPSCYPTNPVYWLWHRSASGHNWNAINASDGRNVPAVGAAAGHLVSAALGRGPGAGLCACHGLYPD